MHRIERILESNGSKPKWFAEKMDMSYNMTNSYVQNSSQPSLEALHRIANILDVDVKDLIVSN